MINFIPSIVVMVIIIYILNKYDKHLDDIKSKLEDNAKELEKINDKLDKIYNEVY